MDTENSKDFMTRRDMRSLVFHLLYAMDSLEYQVSLESILDNFNKAFDLNVSNDSEVFETANSVILERSELDKKIIPFLANWKFERLGLCTKLILRLAFWEIDHSDTDAKIIINEAIELAKCFAEKDSYKFINGILDAAAKGRDKLKNNSEE